MNQDKISVEIAKLQRAKVVLIDYLKQKADDEDWHGVSDAANDLRDIESELKAYWVAMGVMND